MKSRLQLAAVLILALGLSACETEEAPVLSADPQNATVVNLEKHEQRVRVYNCFNHLVFEGIRVVVEPIKTLEIAPNDLAKKDMVVKSQFQNITSGDEDSSIFGGTKFKVNFEQGRHLQVLEGLNEIAYEYDFNGGGSEKGSRYINVTYKQVMRDWVKDEYPSPVECHQGGGGGGGYK